MMIPSFSYPVCIINQKSTSVSAVLTGEVGRLSRVIPVQIFGLKSTEVCAILMQWRCRMKFALLRVLLLFFVALFLACEGEPCMDCGTDSIYG